MLDRIRRRLTLGYVGIFALILAILGAVVLASFAGRVAAQQDELLEQRARDTLDYVESRFLRSEGEGEEDRAYEEDHEEDHSAPSISPIRASKDLDVGVAVVSVGGPGGTLESSPAASSLGMPYVGAAKEAERRAEMTRETVEGPGGGRMRVVSVPVAGSGGEVVVVQAAQSRGEVRGSVGNLALVLVPAGLGGLALAAGGGLLMSRRAMRPVEDSFRRQRAFVADASHELKTPLALVKVGAEIIKRRPVDPENAGVVEDQLSEIDRMDALLSDLLTLARLDAGRLDVQSKSFDLAVVAAEAVDRFLKRASEAGVRIEVEIPDTAPARGDPAKTSQILAVLLDNAVRHTPEGGTVTVFVSPLEGGVRASVADTGPGIPPEHLPRIFDRFYRVQEARTRRGGGTGLGLAIARNLARAQNGELSAGNRPAGGAVFRLGLPAN